MWTYEPSSDPQAFQTSVKHIVSVAFEDALSMYALLAASTSRLLNVDGFFFSRAAILEPSFMQRALKLMQERVEQGQTKHLEYDYSMIRCAVLLGSAESYRGDFAAANIHFGVALKLLQKTGYGQRMTVEKYQGQLLMFDLFFS